MSSNEIQEPIALALAELELIKAHLLKVFAWAGIPHVYVDGELSKQGMELELARVAIPLANSQIVKASMLIQRAIKR